MMKFPIGKKLKALLLYSIAQLIAFYSVASELEENVRIPEAQTVNTVRLNLKTDKIIYKLDEPIQLSIYLANNSDEPVYVESFLDLDLHVSGFYMKLDIFTSDGKPVPYVQHVSDAAHSGEYPRNVKEIIRASYHLLKPKYFYGKTELIHPKLRGIVKGGKYKLVMTYHNNEPTAWSAEEKASLKYYVVGGKLESNEVWIEITP